jgi:DNA-binding MarR family transcriptional regulator
VARRRSPLQHEIRQNRPFRSRTQEGVVGLLRTVDLVRRTLSAVVEPHGITLQQYNVLRILRGAGDDGLPTLDIAERMVERAPGITRLIDRLESKGLVKRERCAEGRRQVLCWINPAGLQLLQGLEQSMARADRDCLGMLSARDLHRLIGLLDQVRAGHA